MKKIFLALLLFLFLISPNVTKADGGIMPPLDRWIQETDQKAVIISEDGVETLVLSTSFRGDAEDFAWIIPTPTKPEVSKGAVGIFESLQKMTYVYDSGYTVYDRMSLGVGSLEMAPAVNVIEQKKVGFYDVSVLEANDKDALYNWLNENGYNYPAYGKIILDDYIQNKWFFTAVKINSEASEQVQPDLRSGTITPLKLVFPTNKIIFPLKISSITTQDPSIITEDDFMKNSINSNTDTEVKEIAPIYPSNYMGITLYVFSDHKKDTSGFTTKYAKWVDNKTIKTLATDDNGDPWYSPKAKKMFLTVLYDNMSTKDMKADLFLTNAKNNDQIPASQFWMYFFLTIFFILLIILSPFGLLYIIFMLLYIFIKSKSAKIVFLISQGLITFMGLMLSILLLVALIQDYYYMQEIISILISCSLVSIAMLAGMILEIVKGKKKGLL